MAHTFQFCTFYLDKLLFGVELKGVSRRSSAPSR